MLLRDTSSFWARYFDCGGSQKRITGQVLLCLLFTKVNCCPRFKSAEPREEIGHFRVPPGPLFQSEGRCSAFYTEIIFHSHANKTHFHKKDCAPSLIFKVRVFGTRKWPIGFVNGLFASCNSGLKVISVNRVILAHAISNQLQPA